MTQGLLDLAIKIDILTMNMIQEGAFYATAEDLASFVAATDSFIRAIQEVDIITPATTTTQDTGAKIVPFKTPCTGERPC